MKELNSDEKKYKDILNDMISNMVNSYKIFWLKGIFLEVINGKEEIPFKSIVCRMISESWNIVIKYHPKLGTSDQLNDVVIKLKEMYSDNDMSSKEKIYHELMESTDMETNNELSKFYYYVPYRLLSVFYKEDIKNKTDSEKNRIIEQKSQQDDEVLYKLYVKQEVIKVNKVWYIYLRDNKEYVEKWIDNEMKKYLIKKNPDIDFQLDRLFLHSNVEEELNNIYNFITSEGYTYDRSIIYNLYLSLKTKPFVILSGISGIGKSKLIELFAKALGATAENKRFNLIPVKHDWSDNTELLGYRNFEGKFVPGIITEICHEAMMHKDLPYFICLDEMNLAGVEYYFSDILSLMETRRLNEDGEIITNNLLIEKQIESKDNEAVSKYGKVYIPENVYIIGIVNMDETTFPFSRKVLDGANTIELNKVNLDFDFDKVFKVEKSKVVHNDFLKSQFLKLKDCAEHREIALKVIEKLKEINNIL